MSYRDLLVHVDDTKACAARIDVAIRMAAAYDAHLTGLYVIEEALTPAYVSGYVPLDLMELVNRQAGERAEAALGRFGEAASRGGIAFETRSDRGRDIEVPSILSLHARYADLVILGQVNRDDPATRHENLPEEVLLSSGRPALIVPYIGAGATLGERVVVAWDASREAARAVSGALPMLERAKSVTVVSVNPRPNLFGHGEEPGADIALHLARHGLKVEVQRLEPSDIDVRNAILSYLADAGCDLLIMGAYGHSRVRELVLGGVTRTMLREMTVPVLMAH